MIDNFDFKKFIMENKLGPYSRETKLSETLQDFTNSESKQVLDADNTLRALQAAVRSGAEVTIDGQKVFKMPMINLATFEGGGRIKLPLDAYTLEAISDSILVDGKPMELIYKTAASEPKAHTKTPEEKDAASKAFQDRYGAGGGYETPFGRYTGD